MPFCQANIWLSENETRTRQHIFSLLIYPKKYCFFQVCLISFNRCLRWAALCCTWRRPTSCRQSILPTPTATSTWTASRLLRHIRGKGRILSSLRSSYLSKSVNHLPHFVSLGLSLPFNANVCRITKSIPVLFCFFVSVICPVKWTDLKSVWATKQRRAKKAISVGTPVGFWLYSVCRFHSSTI